MTSVLFSLTSYVLILIFLVQFLLQEQVKSVTPWNRQKFEDSWLFLLCFSLLLNILFFKLAFRGFCSLPNETLFLTPSHLELFSPLGFCLAHSWRFSFGFSDSAYPVTFVDFSSSTGLLNIGVSESVGFTFLLTEQSRFVPCLASIRWARFISPTQTFFPTPYLPVFLFACWPFPLGHFLSITVHSNLSLSASLNLCPSCIP